MTRKHPMDLNRGLYKLIKKWERGTGPIPSDGRDGIESGRLKNHAKQTGWSSIKFFGFQNQSRLPAFLDLCDVFVLPSVKEPWGLIVNEAMNAGKPIIVSDQVGCAPDLVTNGENGYIFPARSIGQLKRALEDILSDSIRMNQMGVKSLSKINSWGYKEDIEGLRKALGI